MEENNNLTAERSLEIITEQIERSRRIVAKDTGELLFISGLCMIVIAILIGFCIYFTGNMAFYIMYILLPALIWGADRYKQSTENLLQLNITPFRTIILLMGMAIAINGHILKSRWMTAFGILSGIGGFAWEMFNMTQGLLGWMGLDTSEKGIAYGMIPNIMIAIIAFIGLLLPGWMLKRQK